MSGCSGSGRRDNASSMPAGSVMSTRSLEAPDTCAGFASQIRTVAPLATSNSVMALPMPFAPPVTMTDLPSRSYVFGMSSPPESAQVGRGRLDQRQHHRLERLGRRAVPVQRDVEHVLANP